MPETVFGWVPRAVIPGPLPQGPVDEGGIRDWFDWPWEEGFEDDILDGIVSVFDYPGARHIKEFGESAWTRPMFHIDADTSIGPSMGEVASSPLRLVAWGFRAEESLPGFGKLAQFDKYAEATDTAADIVERPEFGGAVTIAITGIMGGKLISGAVGKVNRLPEIDPRKTPQQRRNYKEARKFQETIDKTKKLDEEDFKKRMKTLYPPNKGQQALKAALQFATVTGPAWVSGWLGHVNDQVRLAKGLEPKFGGDGSLPETSHETLGDHLQRVIDKDGLQGLENVKREIQGLQEAIEGHPAVKAEEQLEEGTTEEVIKQIAAASEDIAAWIKERVKNGKYIELLYGNELNFIRRLQDGAT